MSLILKYSHPSTFSYPSIHPEIISPISCSPTTAPSSSPSPLAPISRPAIDPGAAPCSCGCTFIVHAGHRGAKHNHVSKPTHFNGIIQHISLSLKNQGVAREIKVVSGECESLPLLWTIKVPSNIFFCSYLDLHPPRCRHRTDYPPT